MDEIANARKTHRPPDIAEIRRAPPHDDRMTSLEDEMDASFLGRLILPLSSYVVCYPPFFVSRPGKAQSYTVRLACLEARNRLSLCRLYSSSATSFCTVSSAKLSLPTCLPCPGHAEISTAISEATDCCIKISTSGDMTSRGLSLAKLIGSGKSRTS